MQKAPEYIGIFSQDEKASKKQIRNKCKEILTQILQAEETNVPIEKDLGNFEEFHCPIGNPHITCLYLGGKMEKLKQKEMEIYKGFKYNMPADINVELFVYIPNYIMCGFCPNTGEIQVANKYPHLTLLLKNGAKAVQSNYVLQKLFEARPELLKDRNFAIKMEEVQYQKHKCIYVINSKFHLKGKTGSNLNQHKK